MKVFTSLSISLSMPSCLSLPCLFPRAILAKTATEIFDARSPGIVMVAALDQTDKVSAAGTGVILSDGVVVTNCHVIKGADRFKVVHQQKEYPAAIRHSDWDRDVCTLTVKGLRAPAAPLGNTRSLKAGAKVYAIAAPERLALTLLEGHLSGLHEVEGGQYLQITAPISSKSSGGALFDKEGQLVGLTTFYRAKRQNLRFAVPVEWIRELPGRHKTKAAKTDSLIVWLSRAIELKESKNKPALIEHCQLWTNKRPKDIQAWYSLGDAYKEAGQPAKAIEASLKAVRLNPEYASAWFLLGNLYKESGEPDKAIEALQEAARIKPEFANAWFLLGNVYSELRQADKAVGAFQEAVRIDPDLGQAWFLLGIHYAPGQPDKAIEAFWQALRLNPENGNAWYGLGLAYGQSGQPDREIEAYREALRINPKDADVWYSLGAAYKITKQSEKAMEVYHRLKVVNAGKADELYEKYLIP